MFKGLFRNSVLRTWHSVHSEIEEHLLVSVTSMSVFLPQTPPSPNGRSHLLEALFYLRPLSYFYMGVSPSLE